MAVGFTCDPANRHRLAEMALEELEVSVGQPGFGVGLLQGLVYPTPYTYPLTCGLGEPHFSPPPMCACSFFPTSLYLPPCMQKLQASGPTPEELETVRNLERLQFENEKQVCAVQH